MNKKYISKKSLVDALKIQIATNDRQTVKALMRVYESQTPSEKELKATYIHNKVGFCTRDAGILSSFAEQLKAGHTLSEKQMSLARRLMPKYAGQLIGQSIKSGKIRKDSGKYVWG